MNCIDRAEMWNLEHRIRRLNVGSRGSLLRATRSHSLMCLHGVSHRVPFPPVSAHMSRRGRKEDWGGEGSDEEVGASAGAGGGGLSSLPRMSNAALARERRGSARGGEGEDKAASSDDEDDSGADSGAEHEDAEGTRNERERARPAGFTDKEIRQVARMKQQGLTVDEEEEEDEAMAGTIPEGDEGKASDAIEQNGTAAAAPERSHREKMKALFDRKKDDKFMTFDAEDPLKPNPNKRRAAEREDDELDEDGVKDPWLLQTAQDAARAAAGEKDSSGGHFISRSGKPLQASTAALEAEENAPPFDQSQARLVLLRHMRPGESVQKAVRRLGTSAAGGSAVSHVKTKQKNVRSKPREGDVSAAPVTPVDAAAEKVRKASFAELTEAAQGFLNSGYVEIYQDTYEKISKLVEAERVREAQVAQHRAALAAGAAASAAPSAGADARARAAARLQRKRDARAAGLPEPDSDSDSDDDVPPARASTASAIASAPSATETDVQFLYKWSASDSELQGPFSSAKMAEFRAANLLDSSVVLQRVVSGADVATQAKQPWLKLSQVDFQQPHSTASASIAEVAAAGHMKKKFKF